MHTDDGLIQMGRAIFRGVGVELTVHVASKVGKESTEVLRNQVKGESRPGVSPPDPQSAAMIAPERLSFMQSVDDAQDRVRTYEVAAVARQGFAKLDNGPVLDKVGGVCSFLSSDFILGC